MTDNARRAQSIERFDAVAKTTPAAAALRIIEGIEKNQPRILIGNDARFMDLLQRFRPATYWAVLARKIEKMAEGGEVRDCRRGAAFAPCDGDALHAMDNCPCERRNLPSFAGAQCELNDAVNRIHLPIAAMRFRAAPATDPVSQLRTGMTDETHRPTS